MKCKFSFWVLLFSCKLACSQNINHCLYDYNYDSIQVRGMWDIKINLTANSCEIIEDDKDLLTIFPKDTSIDSLFMEFVNASPFITENRVREFPSSDSIQYCFELDFHITLFRKKVELCEYDFWYDTDYHYFTPKMLDFISHISGLMRYYHQQYQSFLIYKKGIPFNYKYYYKRLCDGSINFQEEWNRLKKEPLDIIANCKKYGLIFAQVSINNQRHEASFDIVSLIISERISKDSLMDKSSFLKEGEYNIIKSWIIKLSETTDAKWDPAIVPSIPTSSSSYE